MGSATENGQTRPRNCERPLVSDEQDDSAQVRRVLLPAARRALQEAEERRKLADARQSTAPGAKEVGGPKGPEPTRYGDWEKGGIASDF